MTAACGNYTTWLKQIFRLDLTDSTQSQARMLLLQGVTPDFAVLAREQSAGQGRLGRPWLSRAGLGLYCTVALQPGVQLERWPQLGLVAAVAAADAVAAYGLQLQIKWPNDLYHGGRKVGGILAETVMDAEGNFTAAMVGIGINVGHAREDFPPELAGKADSFYSISGRIVDTAILADALLSCLRTRLAEWREKGFDPIRQVWLQRDCTIGKTVTIGVDGGKARVTAIRPDGCLLVEDHTGCKRSIICDDVILA